VLTRLFVKLFPKKKNEVPRVLGKLVEAFDTSTDPTFLLKRSSSKSGTEVTIALTMSHDENIDWAKVSSSLAHDEGGKTANMKSFFTKAKKYSQNLVSLILPMPTPTSATPSSSAPPMAETTPSEVR
jgi:hypothetical protein